MELLLMMMVLPLRPGVLQAAIRPLPQAVRRSGTERNSVRLSLRPCLRRGLRMVHRALVVRGSLRWLVHGPQRIHPRALRGRQRRGRLALRHERCAGRRGEHGAVAAEVVAR